MASSAARTDNAAHSQPFVVGSMTLTQRRSLITLGMNVLVVLAALVALGVVISYFGTLASTRVGEAYLELTDFLILPLGLPHVRSVYGGVFDVNAAMTVIIFLVLEWALGVWRSRIAE